MVGFGVLVVWLEFFSEHWSLHEKPELLHVLVVKELAKQPPCLYSSYWLDGLCCVWLLSLIQSSLKLMAHIPISVYINETMSN